MPTLPKTPAAVMKWIPHRPPMLLVGGVQSCDAKGLVATRMFTADEVFFQGHFPDEPIVPGVIILEALAQAAALHTSLTKNLSAKEVAYRFSKASDVAWLAPVIPGQTVTLLVTKHREKLGFVLFEATAKVGATVVCKATLTAKVLTR